MMVLAGRGAAAKKATGGRGKGRGRGGKGRGRGGKGGKGGKKEAAPNADKMDDDLDAHRPDHAQLGQT